MKKIIIRSLIPIFILSNALFAKENIKIEITHYGYYSVANNTSTGLRDSAGNTITASENRAPILEETNKIPLKEGIFYGIEYRISGTETGSSVILEFKWSHPEFQPKDGRPSYSSSSIEKLQKIGMDYGVGRRVSNEWASKEGNYTIQIIHNNEVLAEKTFELFLEN